MEVAGNAYNDESLVMKQKKKDGEDVDFQKRGPPHMKAWGSFVYHALQNDTERKAA